jgi:hypothetical protein
VTLYLLDTDHISLQHRAHPGVLERLRALDEIASVALSIITVEEQIRGRLEIILLIIGITAVGRATIVALDLNRPLQLVARQRWVLVGWHPPQEDTEDVP